MRDIIIDKIKKNTPLKRPLFEIHLFDIQKKLLKEKLHKTECLNVHVL